MEKTNKTLRRIVSAALAAALLAGATLMSSCGIRSNDDKEEIENMIYGKLYSGSGTAPVIIDSSYSSGKNSSRTYEQVYRAVNDLRQDIAMVTGAIDYKEIQQTFVDSDELQQERLDAAREADSAKVPLLKTDACEADYAVIIGVIGESKLIDQIIESGKFDEARDIEGSWAAPRRTRLPTCPWRFTLS